MKQVDLQGNVYDIGIEANGFSDKALEQIVEVVRPILNEKDKEIERLNNIITELEKWLEERKDSCNTLDYYRSYKDVLDKLKELKENK